MTTYNTGNPIGSTAVKDLYDNAENLDILTNDRTLRSHPDRLGVPRKTWYGMEQDFQEFLMNSGYQQIGDYGPGLDITARNQVFWKDGELYRAGASLELPYTTTGVWDGEEGESGLFVAVGDQTLRQDLRDSSDETKGAGMIGLPPFDLAASAEVLTWLSNSISIPSVADLKVVDIGPSMHNRRVIVGSFYPGGHEGGGVFTFESNRLKSEHDGRNVISPTVPWDGQEGSVNGFLSGNGETDSEGIGAWVRVKEEASSVQSTEFGGNVQAAGDSLNNGGSIYTGGILKLPVGLIPSSPLSFQGNPPEGILGLTLQGAGKQATMLDFTGKSGVGITFHQPVFTQIKDMGVRGSDLNGIQFSTGAAGEAWHHMVVKDVRVSFNGASGFRAGRGFMGRFEGAYATHNQEAGFLFDGPVHTSLKFDGCYADKSSQSGYHFNNLTYSTLINCAADNNGHHGYRFSGCSTVVMSGCGSESNNRSGVYLFSNSPQTVNRNILIDGLLAFNNNKSNAGYANAVYVHSEGGYENSAHIRGARSHDAANPGPDLTVQGLGAYAVDEHNDFPNGVAAISGGYIQHVPKVLLIEKNVTAATALCGLQSTLGGTTSYSGEITVRASNQIWSSTRVGNTAIYKLLVSKGASGVSMVEMAKTGMVGGEGASAPSFSFSVNGSNQLVATPIGATGANFFFEILTADFVKAVKI